MPASSSTYNPAGNVDTEVLVQPGTGDIMGMDEDRSYGTGPGQTEVNYAVNSQYGGQAGVQTGSSSKLFTLVTALNDGQAPASSAILIRDGRVLLIRRKNPPSYDMFAFPGGRAEPGETPDQTALREFEEETGIRAHSPELFATYDLISENPGRHFFLSVFLVQASGDEIAEAQAIPIAFLENILLLLKRDEIVETLRGPEGGIRLARPAAEISVADVVRAVAGPLAVVRGEVLARHEPRHAGGPFVHSLGVRAVSIRDAVAQPRPEDDHPSISHGRQCNVTAAPRLQ